MVYFGSHIRDTVHLGMEVMVAGDWNSWSHCAWSQRTEWWMLAFSSLLLFQFRLGPRPMKGNHSYLGWPFPSQDIIHLLSILTYLGAIKWRQNSAAITWLACLLPWTCHSKNLKSLCIPIHIWCNLWSFSLLNGLNIESFFTMLIWRQCNNVSLPESLEPCSKANIIIIQ